MNNDNKKLNKYLLKILMFLTIFNKFKIPYIILLGKE